MLNGFGLVFYGVFYGNLKKVFRIGILKASNEAIVIKDYFMSF